MHLRLSAVNESLVNANKFPPIIILRKDAVNHACQSVIVGRAFDLFVTNRVVIYSRVRSANRNIIKSRVIEPSY